MSVRSLLPLALLLALLVFPSTGHAQSAESIVVREAIAEFQRTGRARVLEVGQTILVPYGQVDPVLKTALLRTTIIELGRNEYVVDRFMGDSLRWDVDFGVVGTEASYRQLVSVKPTDQDLTTSLVLTTNTGRIYQLTLDSEPYPGIERTQNPTDIPYTAHVKFYYPEQGSVDGDGLTTLTRYDPNTGQMIASADYEDLASLPVNTASYEIEADAGFPCVPLSAGDNGTQLRIVFPDHTTDPSCSQRFPLYAVDDMGALELLNYSTFGGNTYVTDRIPAESRILFRTAGGVRQVKIRNTAMKRSRGPVGVTLGLGLGTALPSSSAPFRQSFAPGLDLSFSGLMRTSRAVSIGLEVGYRSFGGNATFLDNAVTDALDNTLAFDLADQLGLAQDERVVLYARNVDADVRTTRLSAVGRLSLAPEARVEPYLGARLGVMRRSASTVSFQTSGQVLGADGRYRDSPELDQLIRGSFAGSGSDASASARAFGRWLQGEGGSDYTLPTWLSEPSDPQTGIDLGASFGLALRATPTVRVYAEGEYAYSPIGDREDRALIPLRFGARVDL